MCKHEDKYCPRCNIVFECKAGSIMQCQCSTIQLSLEERVYMESKFEDCLCADCLAALQKEYLLLKAKYFNN